ncbi:MAG: redox-sensing transcriptional repressor Rex [Vulcanimicrobiota bacterium]
MIRKAKIPEPAIARLPMYFKVLNDLKNNGETIVSSGKIAKLCRVKASQFRKDMSYFGEFGIQGLGYPVSQLLNKIADIMRLNIEHNVILVGVGKLGQALAEYPGFKKWGFNINHLYDSDPSKIGSKINNIVVKDIKDLPLKMNVSMGMITVPVSAAQDVADRLVDTGVKSLLNFASIHLNTPKDVVVRNVDVTLEAAILTFQLSLIQ